MFHLLYGPMHGSIFTILIHTANSSTNRAEDMEQRTKTKKTGKEPQYFFYHAEKCAARSEIIDGEIYYHIKFAGQSEFNALYSSKTVSDVLVSEPVVISEEEYLKC